MVVGGAAGEEALRDAAELCGAGRLDEAARLLARALDRTPGLAQAAVELCRILSVQGRWPAAVQVLETVIPHNRDDARLPALLGSLLLALGRPERAGAALRRAAVLDPGSPDVQFGTGALRHGEHRLAAAAAAF